MIKYKVLNPPLEAGIYGSPVPGTDRSESVRDSRVDFINFLRYFISVIFDFNSCVVLGLFQRRTSQHKTVFKDSA